MKTILIRLRNIERALFEEAPIYWEDEELGVGICKDRNSTYPYRFVDIPTGCHFGRTFKTLKECKDMIGTSTYDLWIIQLKDLREESRGYHKLLTERLNYSSRKKL